MLALEKDAQLRLTRAQVEADDIKKHGQIEARRIFEEGKREYLSAVEHERQALHNQLKMYEERLLSDELKNEASVKKYYDKNKSAMVDKFVDYILRLLEGIK